MSYLELLIGPMFSGKTSELIKRYHEKADTENVLGINYDGDTRYAINKIVSHDQQSIASINVNNLYDINNNSLFYKKFINATWIFINEAQFFKDLKPWIIQHIYSTNKGFVLCGLDSDFKTDRFGDLLDLIPHADKVTKLYGQCQYCSNKSLYTHRLTKELEQEVIGTNNYIPLCRSCYHKANM